MARRSLRRRLISELAASPEMLRDSFQPNRNCDRIIEGNRLPMRCVGFECGNTLPLSREATSRLIPKRGCGRALQNRCCVSDKSIAANRSPNAKTVGGLNFRALCLQPCGFCARQVNAFWQNPHLVTNRIRNAAAALVFLCCLVTFTSAFNLPNRSPDPSARLAALSMAAEPAQHRTMLSLADRVAYQRSIEEVYWRH